MNFWKKYTIEDTLFCKIEKNKFENKSCIKYLISNLEKHKEILKGQFIFFKIRKFFEFIKNRYIIY